MGRFQYRAVDERGRVIRGEMEAPSKRDVMDALHGEGLFPVEVKEQKRSRRRVWRLFRRGVSQEDVLLFFRSLSVLVGSGVPVDRALSICMEVVGDSPVRGLIGDVLMEVRGGASLSEALGKYSSIFSRFYVNMIRAGEAGGVLPFVLERICSHMERQREFREKLVSSLVYPAFLVLTAVASVAVLIVFVVPRFMVIFESVNAEPPLVMVVLERIGLFFRRFWPVMALAAVAAVYGLRVWTKRPKGRRRAWEVLLSVPVVGDVAVQLESAKLCGNLGMLILNGVPMLKALGVVKEMFQNPIYREEMEEVERLIREGERLSSALARGGGLWHPMVQGMVSVGEESGELGEMLVRVAEALEGEVEKRLTKLISVIEPVTVLGMGLVVGSIVVSMLSAIFSVNEMVR